MKRVLKVIADRLDERTTWVGLSAAFTSSLALVSQISNLPSWIATVLFGGITISGMIAAFIPEKKNDPKLPK